MRTASSLVPMGLIWFLDHRAYSFVFVLHCRQMVWHHHTWEAFKLCIVKKCDGSVHSCSPARSERPSCTRPQVMHTRMTG